MIVAHDAFEALAGAIALDEATPLERATFATHAATCATCRNDLIDIVSVRDAIGASRDDERWVPSVEARVRAQTGTSRHRRTRVTFGAFHGAIAFSLALNVAFFSGFVGRLATKLHATGEPNSSVVATMWVTERKRHHPSADAATAVVATRVATRPARAIVAYRARTTPHHVTRIAAAATPLAMDSVTASLDAPTAATDAIPDVLAGLDVDADAARRVASANSARCKTLSYDVCQGENAVEAP